MALTTVQLAMQGSPQYYGFKNRIINGAMVINQRAGGTVTGNDGVFSVDRWFASCSPDGKFTMQQSSTAPTGFINSLLATSTSAYSVGSGDFVAIRQNIEGFNVADLGWGTANAKTVTLSFWVQSSLTGTFGGSLTNSAISRSYPFTYTISNANTWTQISVTVAGDTTGTWLTTNGRGICVFFSLGAGSTYSGTAGAWAGTAYTSATGAKSVVGTNGATFYITGVQLEVGNNATGFDYRPYGTELALCQRYFQKTNPGLATGNGGLNGAYFGTTNGGVGYQFPVTLRATPTVTRSSSSNTFYVSNVDGASPGTTSGAVISTTGYWTQLSSMTSAAVGYPIFYNGSLSIEAEL